jgi:hypothetical protein
LGQELGQYFGTMRVVKKNNITVAGSPLPSDGYLVEWQTHSPKATATFAQKGLFQECKVAVTVTGKVVDWRASYPSNEVVYNEGSNGMRTLEKLRFKGSSRVIFFNQ